MYIHMYQHIFTYTSSYVGLMHACHVGSTTFPMRYENPEYRNTRAAAHRPRTRYAQDPHKSVMGACEL